MRECDLIMKGGITSGVVYPFAISKLAERYQLRGIGGTSAGAIAATLAAAAERRRQVSPDKSDKAGFAEIETIAEDLANDMGSLLQPSTDMASPYALLLSLVSGEGPKWKRLLSAIVQEYFNALLIGGLVAAVGSLLALVGGGFWFFVLSLIAGLGTSVVLIGISLYHTLFKELPKNDYGMLPGTTQWKASKPGLTDWLADQIDVVAGNLGRDGKPDAPLTVGQLADAGITVATMTTDLSSQRPFQLPLKTGHHYFSKAEFEILFPERVVRYLIGKSKPLDVSADGGPADLYPLPVGRDFPVLLCARLSLSFPMLIRAVPLWRRDKGLASDSAPEGAWRRCLFSDGGISSNMPVHFFDAWLPRRPTFGISLTDWEPGRHGADRVYLHTAPASDLPLRVRALPRLGAFLFSIVNAAKDWQDTLQSRLPGFADRIVEIRLGKHEGGMNLGMDRATIEALSELGRQAGTTLTTKFDFDDNRWRRALSLLPEIEKSLEGFAAAYDARPGEGDLLYKELLTQHQSTTYEMDPAWRKDVLKPFADSLATIGRRTAKNRKDSEKEILRDQDALAQDAKMRLLAEADRSP